MDKAMDRNERAGIGGKIRDAREDLGLTQTKLAKLAGMSSRTVRNIELGHTVGQQDIISRLTSALSAARGDVEWDDPTATEAAAPYSVEVTTPAGVTIQVAVFSLEEAAALTERLAGDGTLGADGATPQVRLTMTDDGVVPPRPDAE